MSFVRYYIGKLNLSPRFDSRCEDVLSAALSVYKIESTEKFFYIIFSSSDFRHVLDVMRVFRANGILGGLCYHNVKTSNDCGQKMLALRIRNRNQKFIQDVTKTISDATYYRDVVLPEYTAVYQNKKYILPELFGPYGR